MQSLTTGMTLEEQLGQLLMVGFPGTTVTAEIIDLIQNHHVGGIVLFARNIQDAHQVRQLTAQLQRIARDAGHRYPLLISIDQENGMVRRLDQYITELPGNMALGAIGSAKITYDVAYTTGLELKALGINMNLAPDVDVNNNPNNPVIGVRSFGEDPQQVAELAAAAVQGYKAAGIITNLKHFPGHGDTAVDSHLALPTILYDLQRLEQIELVPFKSGIAAGAESIMIAHIYLPALMSEELLPATISPEIISGLLREKLGYEGLIITDCMEMNALAQTIGVERGAARAVQAGIDLVLVSHRYDRQKGSLEAIKEAIDSDTIPQKTIHTAAERVLEMKARMLTWEEALNTEVPEVVRHSKHLTLSQQAYELSATLVRNEQGLIPLNIKSDERLLVVFPFHGAHTQAADRRYHAAESALIENLRRRHAHVEILKFDHELTPEDYQHIDHAATVSAMIIVVTVNANLNKHQGKIVQRLRQSECPLIGLAVYNPYDLLEFPDMGTYLVTYEYTPPALAAAVRVLFGEIQALGHLPVSLPGLYPLVSQRKL